MNAEDEPARIRAQLERDRAALVNALQGLRDRLTPGGVLREGASGLLRGSKSPYAHALDEAVRSNPLALALTGAGLAWLAFGRNRDENPIKHAAVAQPVDDDDWMAGVETLRTRARALLRRIDDAERRGLAGAEELSRHRDEVITALAQDMRQAMGRGLDGLDAAARAATMAAREAALTARIESETAATPHTPVLGGALLAAAGAALAAILPQGKVEADVLGRARDQMGEELRRVAVNEGRHLRETAVVLADALKAEIELAQERIARVEAETRKSG